MLDYCTIPGATATVATTPSAFMQTELFVTWIKSFAAFVPVTVQHPFVLVMDGCSSHYSVEVTQAAMEMNVLLVCLPANSTHLLQPLDVACFSTLKNNIQSGIRKYMLATGATSFPRQKAILIGPDAWIQSQIGEHLTSGFAAIGLFPVDRVAMARRFGLFKENGSKRAMVQWLNHQAFIQDEVLVLPRAQQTKAKRKVVKIGGRLLTKELLHDEATKKSKKRKAREALPPSRNARKKTSQPTAIDHPVGMIEEAIV